MSLVVEQTLPYTHQQLQLDNPYRWTQLFPLMRPAVKIVDTSNGQAIAIDTSLSKSKEVLIVAVGRVGNFSSKIWSKSHLSAFTTAQCGELAVSGKEFSILLKEHGFPTQNGLIILRSNTRENTEEKIEGDVLEMVVQGDLSLDHILSLLSATKPEVKQSFEKTKALLDHFSKSAARINSTFHANKIGNEPLVVHEVGTFEFNSAKKSIDKDLGHLLSSRSSEGSDIVYSVHFSDVNGLSRLENNILAHEISEYFSRKNLPLYLTQSTITDSNYLARGWSISLSTIPSQYLTPRFKPTNSLSNTTSTIQTTKSTPTSKITFSDPLIRKKIIAGCNKVIQSEPTITEYDTIVGDGDCGYTLRDGAKQVLSFIEKADLSNLPSTLSSLVEDLEINMGGTSGALYCIFLSSLSTHLSTAFSFAEGLKGALEDLLRYTRARLGDRTCLDCLIPFVETLGEEGSENALLEAKRGVDETKRMEAKLGRSSYLDESATRGVPDPGAYGLLMLLEGMVGAVQG